MEKFKFCNYCKSENISKECSINHRAHMDAVKLSHEHTVDFVNDLVCKKIISTNDWNKIYTDKFNETYDLKIDYLLKLNSNEYYKKNVSNVIPK